MNWGWLTCYLATIVILGTAGIVLAFGPEKLRLSDKLGLVLVLGVGSLGYGLYLLALFGVRPGRWSLVVLCVIAAAAVSMHLVRREKIPFAAYNSRRCNLLGARRCPGFFLPCWWCFKAAC